MILDGDGALLVHGGQNADQQSFVVSKTFLNMWREGRGREGERGSESESERR